MTKREDEGYLHLSNNRKPSDVLSTLKGWRFPTWELRLQTNCIRGPPADPSSERHCLTQLTLQYYRHLFKDYAFLSALKGVSFLLNRSDDPIEGKMIYELFNGLEGKKVRVTVEVLED